MTLFNVLDFGFYVLYFIVKRHRDISSSVLAKWTGLSGLGKGVNVGKEFFPLWNLAELKEVRKVPEGSGRFRKVPEGSGRFWKVSLSSPPPPAVTQRRPVQQRIDFTPITIH